MKTFSIFHRLKAMVILLAIFVYGTVAHAQDITGQWNGVLSVQGMNLRIVFHINRTDGGYTSTMDSPDQGAAGIPVTTTSFDGSNLSLAIPNLALSYQGEFKTDSVVGTFSQGGLSIPMILKKIKAANQPQEPKLPYPYRSEDITFENKTLAGTLTMPETGHNFAAVILRAQDRIPTSITCSRNVPSEHAIIKQTFLKDLAEWINSVK